MNENYYWKEKIKIKSFPALTNDIITDVLIIGGGITGVLCAYELSKRNINYVLLEKDKIADKNTKKTTAFISALHETLYQDIVKSHGMRVAKQYLEINLLAIKKYKELSKTYNFDFKECESTIYSIKEENIILKEKETLKRLNYDCELINKLPFNLPISLGITFKNQGQLHPLKLINELSKNLNIYENSEVIKIKDSIAYTKNYKIKFNKVIIATQYPFKNISGGYFTKLTQRRSYVAAFPKESFLGTYCNIDDNSFYFRSHGNYMIVGGYDRDHKNKEIFNFKNIIKETFKEQPQYYWSGQDCISLDGLPYIGRLDRFHKNYYVATGFNLWGYTLAMASSFMLADIIENKNEYPYFSPLRKTKKKALLSNFKNSIKNIATFKTPRCRHLGCALNYNELEQTWECPCHGSRYDKVGNVIDGPSKKNIKKIE